MYGFRQFIQVASAVATGAFIGVYCALHITHIAINVVTQ